jgi:hypothetical protein
VVFTQTHDDELWHISVLHKVVIFSKHDIDEILVTLATASVMLALNLVVMH